jgi:hypothetical protein
MGAFFVQPSLRANGSRERARPTSAIALAQNVQSERRRVVALLLAMPENLD